ncbi:hypothetical protein BaRGS_00036695 [Batillaria attramentaria]|uniref:Peptidase A1 domain-containing protein n=1 Tax=Batillaria attramentaria TaxID=370345 RepID=A0ABD0JB10_9CAEN
MPSLKIATIQLCTVVHLRPDSVAASSVGFETDFNSSFGSDRRRVGVCVRVRQSVVVAAVTLKQHYYADDEWNGYQARVDVGDSALTMSRGDKRVRFLLDTGGTAGKIILLSVRNR